MRLESNQKATFCSKDQDQNWLIIETNAQGTFYIYDFQLACFGEYVHMKSSLKYLYF